MHVANVDKVTDLAAQLEKQKNERAIIAQLEIKMTGVTAELKEIGRAAILAEVDRKIGLIKSRLNVLGVATD